MDGSVFQKAKDLINELKDLGDVEAKSPSRLSHALKTYTEALEIAGESFLWQEIPELACRCSKVYLELENYDKAIHFADICAFLDIQNLEAFWYSFKAHKEIRKDGEALKVLKNGYNISLSADVTEEFRVKFLTELVILISTVNPNDENRETVQYLQQAPDDEDILVQTLERLANKGQWMAVSLLVTGKHQGPKSILDDSAHNCPAKGLSVGRMLKSLDKQQMKTWGMNLAVALLKNKASFESIESCYGIPVLHASVQIAVETENTSLVEIVLRKYAITKSRRHATNSENKTAYQVFMELPDTRRNTLCCKRLQHQLELRGTDDITYIYKRIQHPLLELHGADKCRKSETKETISCQDDITVDKVKMTGNEPKQCGNLAFKERRYIEAIESYKLSLSETTDRKESAVVLGNIAECYLQMRKYTEALEHAEKSIKYDGNHWKNYVRCGKALTETRDFRRALTMYIKALDTIEKKNTFSDRTKIVMFIAIVASRLDQDSEQKLNTNTEILHSIPLSLWIHAAYLLLEMKNWEPSCFACGQVPMNFRIDRIYSLRPFYDISMVTSQPWTMGFMQFLLENRSELSSLTDGLDESYIHAFFRIMLHTDIEIEGHVIMSVAQAIAKERDLVTDTSENNLFHLIVKEGTHCIQRQMYCCHLLFRLGLADLLLSCDKKGQRPIYYVKNKHGPLYFMLRDVMQQLGDSATSGDNKDLKQAEEMVSFRTKTLQGLQHMIKVLKQRKLPHYDEEMAVNYVASNLSRDALSETAYEIVTLHRKIFHRIMTGLTREQNWHALCYLHKEFKKRNKNTKVMFAAEFNIFDFIQSTTVLTEEEQVAIFHVLHEAGISKSGKDQKIAMRQLLENQRHLACLFLMENGLSPRFYCTDEISPMFLATRVALGSGNCKVLEFLLQKHAKRKKEYDFLDPNKVDNDGYSLFHHVCLSDYPIEYVKKVACLLAKHKVSTNVVDSKGKEPKDYLSAEKEDLRKFINTQRTNKSKRSMQTSTEETEDPLAVTDDNSKGTVEPASIHSKDETAKITYNKNMKQRHEHINTGTAKRAETSPGAISKTIEQLKEPRKQQKKSGGDTMTSQGKNEKSRYNLPQATSKGDHNSTDTDNTAHDLNQHFWKKTRPRDDVPLNDKDEQIQNDIVESPLVMSDSAEDTDSAEDKGNEDEVETDPILRDIELLDEEIKKGIENLHSREHVSEHQREEEDFRQTHVKENLTLCANEIPLDQLMESVWQVEITSEVEKALTDGSTPLSGRAIEEAVIAMTKLALSKNINSQRIKTESSLQLYEVCVSDREKMIWEKVVTYSMRDNPIPSDDRPKVYSEVIRIWNVVPSRQSDKCVLKILKIYKHSQYCTRPRKLALQGKQRDAQKRDMQFPKLYRATKDESSVSEYDIEFAPPAISKTGEFNLIRFKEFTSEFATFVLRNVEKEAYFPFKVFEQEHAIIEMSMEKPIVLQGRSGTGKTTCCLYRLWKQFVGFWEPISSKLGLHADNDANHKEDRGSTDALQPDYTELTRQTIEAMKTANEEIYDEEPYPELSEASQSSAEDSFEEVDINNSLQQQNEEFTQIFITKNQHLCQQVQGQFRLLLNCKEWTETHLLASKKPLPYSLIDVDRLQHPLFLSSRQLLLMLDASLDPPYFFDRNEDMGLQYEVQGWSYATSSILECDDSDDDQDDEYTNSGQKSSQAISASKKYSKVRSAKRREVTYEFFEREIWPKIKNKTKKEIQCHPSMVWKEIVSFIKGSYECMTKHRKGVLPFEDYLKIGRKKAPDFDESDREIVYDLFNLYEKHKRKNGLFDEMDVVRYIHERMTDEKIEMFKFQQIYVDETQDFTQAELWLILRLCQSPNQMFLAGDTAQAIMHGISFRFADLVSLFKFYEVECREDGLDVDITPPRKPYQLCENYRSHNGVLNLAASVLDIILEYFEESVDRLGRDIGMYRGPKPAIVHCENEKDLINLLNNNKRETSKVEFGAHQAILVLNDAEKDTLPKEFDKAIKLTIYEAKGLEFDDVLIYNFFKGSNSNRSDRPTDKQHERQCRWPIVTTFLRKLLRSPREELIKKQIYLEKDFTTEQLPRGKEYDPKQDRALCTLLKQLYTAISRARVNVWIFDSDEEQRQHMYLYFRARGLVETITKDNFQERTFAKKTSREKWIKQGEKMMEKGMYLEAAKCFKNGRDTSRVTIALATHQMSVAESEHHSIQKHHLYLDAANRFLQCNCPKYRQNSLAFETSNICSCQKNAIRCFRKAKRRDLLAKLLEKMGEFQRAGENYQRLKRPLESARCFKEGRRFDLAVEILHDNQMFTEAKSACMEYNDLKDKTEENDQVSLYAPESFYSVDFFTYKEAETLHESCQRQKMVDCLKTIKDTKGAVDFLLQRDYVDDALHLLKEKNSIESAYLLSLKYGRVEEAITISKQLHFPRGQVFVARCLLTYVKLQIRDDRKNIVQYRNLSPKVIDSLQTACSTFDYFRQKNHAGEAFLLLGMTKGDIGLIGKAFGKFSHTYPKNLAGMLECMEWMMRHGKLQIWKQMTQVILGMENLANIVHILTNRDSYVDTSTMDNILDFYGFHQHEDESLVELYPPHKSFYLVNLGDVAFTQNNRPVTLNKRKICETLVGHLVTRGKFWFEKLQNELTRHRLLYARCPRYEFGCTRCKYAHKVFNAHEHKMLIIIDLWFMALEYYVNSCQGLHHEKLFQSIRRFLDDLMNVSSSSDYLGVISWVKNIFNKKKYGRRFQTEEPFPLHIKEMIVSYISKRRREVKLDNCCLSSEILMETLLLYNLFELQDLAYDIPIDTVLEFEHLAAKEIQTGRANQKSLRKHEFSFITDKRTGKSKARCMAREFYNALDHLLRLNDPLEALLKFIQFSRHISLYTAHLVERTDVLTWIEYMMTIGLAYLAKNFDHTLVLPTSYLLNLEMVDAVYHRIVAVLSTLSVSQPKSHALKYRKQMGFFSKDLVRAMQCFKRVFKENDPESLTVFKRILIANLTYLCNIPLASQDTESSIVQMLYSLMTTTIPMLPECYLKQLISSLNGSRNQREMCLILCNLVKSDGGNLCVYKWSSAGQLEKTSRDIFADMSESPYSVIIANQGETEDAEFIDKDEMSRDNDMAESEETERAASSGAVFDVMTENQERIAGKYFTKWIFYSKIRNLKQRIIRYLNNELKKRTEEMFADVIVDEDVCGICGVEFSDKGPESNMSDRDRETHCKSDLHLRKEKDFNDFMDAYMSVISKPLYFTEHCIETYNLYTKQSLTDEIESQRRNLVRIFTEMKMMIRSIRESRSWENHGALKKASHELETATEAVLSYIRKEKEKKRAKEKKQEEEKEKFKNRNERDKLLYGDMSSDDEDEDDIDYEKSSQVS